MNPADLKTGIITLGIILVGGLVGGKLAGIWHLPRVTGYLVAGLLIGPSFARLTGLPQLIGTQALDSLRIVSDIALGLIMLNIGGQCRTEHLKRWKQRLIWFACGEIA